LNEVNLSDLLHCHFFITRKTAATISSTIHEDENIRWFNERMQFGRPNFEKLFGEIALAYHKQRIGVFYCGPKPLAGALQETCNSTKVQGNALIFHKESFS